ncbi:hypothetical protein [Klebsiella phage 05F01]|nr:hypothetical protein [Klebsiella phage 05F01]
MDIASETLSLTWWKVIIFKVIKNTSETMESLDRYGVDYLMDVFEYISFDEYMNALQQKSSVDIASQRNRIGKLFQSLPN